MLLDAQQILQSIVAQHGLLVPRAKHIYSFSHLTFQEYFTARQIIEVDKSTELVLQNLVEHLWQKSWQEVFLLAVEMSSNADFLVLLIKNKIDSLLANNPRLQEYLIWLDKKSLTVNRRYSLEEVQKIKHRLKFKVEYNLSLYRSLYFSLFLSFYIYRILDLDSDLYPIIDFALYIALNFYLCLSRNIELDFSQKLFQNLNYTLKLIEQSDPQLYQAIKNLQAQLPDREDETIHQEWWHNNGKEWAEELRTIMVKYRNIGHDWQFNDEQQELLIKYYQANQFLTQCLAQECYVSRSVRQYIEETLLLPISEIKKYGLLEI